MTKSRQPHVTFCRWIVLRDGVRPDRQVTLQWASHVVIVPVWYGGRSFGQRQYTWDGHETTVQGLPVYRA